MCRPTWPASIGAMIRIQVNADAVARGLDNAAKKQLPFAIAKALTLTAKAAQADVIAHLGDTLTIRNAWISKGIRIKPATKRTLTAEIGSRDRFMALQAQGGERAGKGSGAVAVPVAARRDKAAITRPGKWPGKILDNSGFKAKIGNGHLGVFKRIGKGKRARTVLFYVLAKRVAVRARWPLAAQVNATAARVWPGLIRAALADALAGAKA